MRIFASILLLLSLAGAAEKPPWRTGKLLSIDQQHWTSTGGSTVNGHVDDSGNFNGTSAQSSWGHNTYHAAIDDGEYTYFAERTLSFRWQHDPVLTENADVSWRLDGNNLIVKDDRGKEFKMRLIKKRKDEVPAPPSQASGQTAGAVQH